MLVMEFEDGSVKVIPMANILVLTSHGKGCIDVTIVGNVIRFEYSEVRKANINGKALPV